MFIKKINMYVVVLSALSVFMAHGAAEDKKSIKHIWIQALDGQQWKFGATGNDTAQDVKRSIVHLVHTPWEQQRLLFQGQQLEDSKTLAEAGVVNESVLHLIASKNLQNRFSLNDNDDVPVATRCRCPFFNLFQ